MTKLENWRYLILSHIISDLVGGFNRLEKYDFVSDDDIPNIWKVIKFHGSSHHQPEIFSYLKWEDGMSFNQWKRPLTESSQGADAT